MKSIVRESLVKAMTKERVYVPSGAPRLYPSSAGDCARKDLHRIAGLESDPLDVQVLDAMGNGVSLEYGILKNLQDVYGFENVSTQVVLQNEYWSGKADFVLYHCFDKDWNRVREDGPQPIIIELKCKSPKWWDYNKSLPLRSHVIQVALYEYFYEQKTGIKPELRLYVKGWTEWAEFVIQPTATEILFDGMVDGVERRGSIPVNIEALREQREYYMKHKVMPDVPELTPKSLIDRGCLFATKKYTKIGCGYAKHCFPNGELDQFVS